jgi:hypothetical protein
MIFFQQYGTRRTGTNYIKDLLEINFANILVLPRLTWKHGTPATNQEYLNAVFPMYPDMDVIRLRYFLHECQSEGAVFEALANAVIFEEIKHLIMIKDPYAWIDSMWRWALNADEQNQPYIFFKTDKIADRNLKSSYRLRDNEQGVIDSIHSFNERYGEWLNVATEVIRYEDLLCDERRTIILKELATKYKLIGREQFENCERTTDPFPAVQLGPPSGDMRVDYKDYYLEKRYLSKIPANICKIITEEVNWELLAPYGYTPI